MLTFVLMGNGLCSLGVGVDLKCLGDDLYDYMGRLGDVCGGKESFGVFGKPYFLWPGSNGERSFVMVISVRNGSSNFVCSSTGLMRYMGLTYPCEKTKNIVEFIAICFI